MKQTSSWKEYLASIAPFLLATSAFFTPTLPMKASELQNRAFSRSKSTLAAEVVQDSDNCQQVIAKRGLYVREKPTVYSNVVGIIAYGRNVGVAGTVRHNWLPISAPLKGYVYAEWIGRCQVASLPPSNCRRVIAKKGIYARREPASNSMLGYISSGRRVIITGQGTNGWVPISIPFKGYVPSNQLGYCRNFSG